MDLVRVEKRILRFPAVASDASATSSDTLVVSSLSALDLAFKVKTTNQSRYIVRPNVGLIPAHSSLPILIGLHASPHVPAPGPSKDKFLLCVAPAPPESPTEGLPDNYWHDHESRHDVQRFKFKVEFVQQDQQPQPQPQQQPPDQIQPVHHHPPAPRQRDLPPALAPTPSHPPASVVASPVVVEPSPTASPPAPAPPAAPAHDDAPAHPPLVPALDPDHLLHDRNYDAAITRVRDLQALLDAKNLELARLRTELAETKADTERVLNDAPKTPLPANKFLADPFGGVSVAGFGLMLLLFLVLVNVILRIV